MFHFLRLLSHVLMFHFLRLILLRLIQSMPSIGLALDLTCLRLMQHVPLQMDAQGFAAVFPHTALAGMPAGGEIGPQNGYKVGVGRGCMGNSTPHPAHTTPYRTTSHYILTTYPQTTPRHATPHHTIPYFTFHLQSCSTQLHIPTHRTPLQLTRSTHPILNHSGDRFSRLRCR